MQKNTITLEQLHNGAVPKDTYLVTVEKTATFEEVKANDYNVPEGSVIVAPNPKWVAYSPSKDVYYSLGSNDEIVRYDIRHRGCSRQKFKNGRLKTIENINLLKRKDVIEMEQNKTNQDAKSMEESLSNIDFGGALGDFGAEDNTLSQGVQEMDAFDGATENASNATGESSAELSEKEEKKRKAEERKTELEQMISADVSGIQLADITVLSQFNKRYGRLMGYITNNDALIKFGTSTVILKDPVSKRPLLSKTATAAVRDAINRGQSITNYAKSNFQTETSLTRKQTTPGKVLGTVLAIPEGGNVQLSDLFNESAVKPDESKTDLQFVVADNDESIQLISQLFNGSIKESEVTFGDQATEVRVHLRLVDTKDEDDMPIVLKKFSLKPFKRSNKMTETSYLPLKTYKTVVLDDTISEEMSHEMAKSSFRHLYQSSVKSVSKKIDVLRPEDKELIKQSEDGVFSSRYFTTDISSRLPLEIKSAFSPNKDDKVQIIEIPLKEEKPSKNGNNPTFKYIAYDCLGALETPEAKELNSLAQARAGKKFSVFFNAVGGDNTINEEVLRSIKPRRSSKSSKNAEIDNRTIRELLAAKLQGQDGVLKDDGKGTATTESLQIKLYQAKHSMAAK